MRRTALLVSSIVVAVAAAGCGSAAPSTATLDSYEQLMRSEWDAMGQAERDDTCTLLDPTSAQSAPVYDELAVAWADDGRTAAEVEALVEHTQSFYTRVCVIQQGSDL